MHKPFITNGGECNCRRPDLQHEKRHDFVFRFHGELRNQTHGHKMRCLNCGGYKWWGIYDPRLEQLNVQVICR